MNTGAAIFFIHYTLSQSLLQIVQFHENNPDGIQYREHCSLNNHGEITQKVCKQELSFLYATHCHDLFYITVKYHSYSPKGIQVTERTRYCIRNNQGEITQKV